MLHIKDFAHKDLLFTSDDTELLVNSYQVTRNSGYFTIETYDEYHTNYVQTNEGLWYDVLADDDERVYYTLELI